MIQVQIRKVSKMFQKCTQSIYTHRYIKKIVHLCFVKRFPLLCFYNIFLFYSLLQLYFQFNKNVRMSDFRFKPKIQHQILSILEHWNSSWHILSIFSSMFVDPLSYPSRDVQLSGSTKVITPEVIGSNPAPVPICTRGSNSRWVINQVTSKQAFRMHTTRLSNAPYKLLRLGS